MPVNYNVAQEQFERYCYYRDNGHLDFVAKANKCDNYFAGQQWDPATLNKLKAQRRPALTINKTLATMATVFGEQLEARADVAFLPMRDGSEETASALNKVFIQIANNNMYQWRESEMAADGFVTSRGFLDVRVAFNDHMQGEVVIRKRNPRNVLIDPEGEEYDPDEWKGVMLSKWLSPIDIALMYNEDDATYLKEKNGSEYMMGYDSIDRPGNFGGLMGDPTGYPDSMVDPAHRRIRVIEYQHKQLRMAWHIVDLRTGDMRALPKEWNERRVEDLIQKMRAQGVELGKTRKLVEQIKWTVTADNVVLFDDWSPYKHFTVVPYFPFFRNGNTIGLVENIISPQDLLNKTSSQELHVINTTANSGWKVKSGAMQNMDAEELEQRGAETGLVVELDDVKNLEKIQPNQVPSGLDRLSFKADEWLKGISGVSDSMRGFDRADVAAKAIQAKQSAGSINLAKPFDNLMRTRHFVARNVLDLVQTYYNETRLIHITSGRDGASPAAEQLIINEPTPEGHIANDLTVGEYEVAVTTVPSRRTWEEGQFFEILKMREAGIPVPDQFVVEYSHLEKKQELLEAMSRTDPEADQLQMQMAQLEIQAKQVEIAAKAADARLKEANAKLAESRANSTLWDMTADEDPAVGQAEQQVLAAQQHADQIGLQHMKMQEELNLKRQQQEHGQRMDKVKLLIDARNKREQQQQQQQQKAADTTPKAKEASKA